MPGAHFNNLRNLHIIRGLAAFVVVVFHAKFALWVGGNVYTKDIGLNSPGDYFLFAIDMLSSCGEQCVIIFFILSAIVIRHSFEKYKDNLMQFYKVRLLRIYLPFLFSLLFAIIALVICVRIINPDIYGTDIRNYNVRLTDAYNQLSVNQVMNTIFFTGSGEYAGANFAYWSLGHELLFYILFPFYYRFSNFIKIGLAIILILVYAVTGMKLFYFQVFFLAGLLMYSYFANFSAKPFIKNRFLSLGVIALLYISINLVLKLFHEQWADVLTLVFCLFLFDFMLHYSGRANSLLMKLGDISYTLYLNHLPLLMIFYSFVSLFTGKLLFYSRLPYYGGVLFAVIFSIPLYVLIEKPSVALLKKVRR